MNNHNKSSKYDIVRAAAVQRTATYFKVKDNYVRQIVRGVVAKDEIKEYYNQAYLEIKKAITPVTHEESY